MMPERYGLPSLMFLARAALAVKINKEPDSAVSKDFHESVLPERVKWLMKNVST